LALCSDFPTESAAWAEVEGQHLQLNEPNFKPRMTFAHLAQHFMTHELGEQTETADPKSHTTIAGYKRILKNRCIDRWGKRAVLSLEPLEVEQWLKAIKRDEGLANPTLDKIRRVMSLVFKHGQRYGLIPRTQESNPMRFVRCKTTSSYEAMILTPKQAFDVLMHRISECGLAMMSVTAVQDFYRSAHFVCRIGPGHFPSARAIQELVQAWKQMRKNPTTVGGTTEQSAGHSPSGAWF
jgi:hypothetical protein